MVWQPSSADKTMRCLCTPFLYDKRGNWPPQCLQNGCGIDSTVSSFGQRHPYYKRMQKLQKGFANKVSGNQVLLTKRFSTQVLLTKRSGNQALVMTRLETKFCLQNGVATKFFCVQNSLAIKFYVQNLVTPQLATRYYKMRRVPFQCLDNHRFSSRNQVLIIFKRQRKGLAPTFGEQNSPSTKFYAQNKGLLTKRSGNEPLITTQLATKFCLQNGLATKFLYKTLWWPNSTYKTV